MQAKEAVTDAQLIEMFLKGSEESFEELIGRYETKAYNLAMRLTRNEEDAREVLQDVFVTLYRKLGSFQGKSAFSSWLYRITVNAAFMKIRKRKTQVALSVDDVYPQVVQAHVAENEYENRADSMYESKELRLALEKAISKLPEDYKAVFVLRDVDGLSSQEVSEILSLSIPAVKSRLHRSRLMLRRRLKHLYDHVRTDSRFHAPAARPLMAAPTA